jgi:hypothetical protein
MIASRRERIVESKGDPQMKKLATLMLALTFAFGTVAVAFAQDAPKKEDTKKKKKGSKKKEDAPKKDGGAAH